MKFQTLGIDLRMQNRIQIDCKFVSKMACLNATTFCQENQAQDAPKKPQDAQQTAQDAPKTPQDAPKTRDTLEKQATKTCF